MNRDIWTLLWASEVDLTDLRVGTIVAFTKASMRAGEYGLADALIAGLDRIPLTHAGIVTSAGAAPELTHSTLAGVRREPLTGAAEPHRHAPIFIFGHASASEETLRAAADEAARRHAKPSGVPLAYPAHDLLVAAVLLRARNGERFDEHAHRRLAALFATILSAHSEGRMCAAFIAEVFDVIGMPVAPPDERTAHDRNLIEAYESMWILPPWAVEVVGVGLAGLATELHSSASDLSETDSASNPELVRVLGELAADRTAADSLARWLIAPVRSIPDIHPAVRTLLDVVVSDESIIPDAGGLPARFTTVNDLLRSPDFTPLGHCIDWWSEPPPIPNDE